MEMANSELLTTGDFCMSALSLVVVVTIGIRAGRGQNTSEHYFVAGRQVHWFFLRQLQLPDESLARTALCGADSAGIIVANPSWSIGQ